MKKYWLVLAMGISLSIYSCNKSTSEPKEPQPRTASANEEADDSKVLVEDFKKDFAGYTKILEYSRLDMIVRLTADSTYCVLQLVKSGSQSASRLQICKGDQDYALANCIVHHLTFHPDEPVTITNCGDRNPKTFCAYIP